MIYWNVPVLVNTAGVPVLPENVILVKHKIGLVLTDSHVQVSIVNLNVYFLSVFALQSRLHARHSRLTIATKTS